MSARARDGCEVVTNNALPCVPVQYTPLAMRLRLSTPDVAPAHPLLQLRKLVYLHAETTSCSLVCCCADPDSPVLEPEPVNIRSTP